MVQIVKCNHKILKVVLLPGRDLEICANPLCGEVVRDRPVNEKLPAYYKNAIKRFGNDFWGGVHHRPPRRGRSEE